MESFEALDTVVVALSQEDTDLESHGKMPKSFGPERKFEVLADLGREATGRLDRTTAYLVDTTGTVRQIFPMTVMARPSWDVVLAETRRVLASDGD